jgi:PKD repeat protein
MTSAIVGRLGGTVKPRRLSRALSGGVEARARTSWGGADFIARLRLVRGLAGNDGGWLSLRGQRVRSPVGAVLEVGRVGDLYDVRAVAVRGVEVVLTVEEHAEHDLRPIRRPVRLEGEVEWARLELDQLEPGAVRADDEQDAFPGFGDDLLPVWRPLGGGDLVWRRDAVGGDLPETCPVEVLHEQGDLLGREGPLPPLRARSEAQEHEPRASAYWWDWPTARWYDIGPYYLTVSTDGTGSGEVSSSPAGISCGYSCQASFNAGTAITLTATPDASSIFTGWSGDCSGTGSCQVTIDQARSVTATFALKAFDLTVSKQGAGSGQVSSSPAGISCGDSCQASFTAGTAVTLTATPDASSIFTGWSGDCSGTDTCKVTMDQARSVTATFALNAPPHASFTVSCAGLSCSFDGSGSADPDGSIATYAWNFGNGASGSGSGSGSGQTVSHTYSRAGSYTVTLTVTDSAGATATDSKAINPISLSARGYKLKGLQKADLSWSGPSGTTFDLYRSGLKIATVQTTACTDNVNTKGPGSYTYKVCETGSTTCSNDATVSF